MFDLIIKNKNTIILNLFKYNFIFIVIFSFLVIPFNNCAYGDNLTITTEIKNPLGNNINSIPTLVAKALEFVAKIAMPVIVFFIVYSGFLFIEARGNKDKLTTAKKTLSFTLIGAAVILGAFVIAKAISGTVEQLG